MAEFNVELFKNVLNAIIVTKDFEALEQYANEPNPISMFIICRTISRNSAYENNERIQSILSTFQSIVFPSVAEAYITLANALPKGKNPFCKKW